MTNPSGITNILVHRGVPFSRTVPGRITGVHQHTTGFKVEENKDDGTVNLYFSQSSLLRADNDLVRSQLEYAKTILESKGYSVEREQWDGHEPYLSVRET